ncbi:hypothetical protein HBI68_254370 [Parastagonospora nodorum]|nr:hypothetical protein HBI51_251000 [Parastagonospora nodorum]KAH6132840.1 hypothetical protein HBI68_254370 [Parastagonospora nodorum]
MFSLMRLPTELRTEIYRCNTRLVGCKDYECRHRSMQHEHTIKAMRADKFAFGLFLTSKQVSYDASKIFFGETHFVFESRFDLHFFLQANKHAKLVKSLTFNGQHDRFAN